VARRWSRPWKTLVLEIKLSHDEKMDKILWRSLCHTTTLLLVFFLRPVFDSDHVECNFKKCVGMH